MDLLQIPKIGKTLDWMKIKTIPHGGRKKENGTSRFEHHLMWARIDAAVFRKGRALLVAGSDKERRLKFLRGHPRTALCVVWEVVLVGGIAYMKWKGGFYRGKSDASVQNGDQGIS